MTSKEIGIRISYYNALSGSDRLTNRALALPLWEIALQLAVRNEREHEKVESFSLPYPPEKEDLWPKIERVGSRWALWMHPLAQAQIFETEELAKEHLRKIAQMMNDYVPPKKPSEEGLDKTETCKSGPVGERGGDSPAEQCARDFAQVINKWSLESESSTPDFILANYLKFCLAAFATASNQREQWYGRKNAPGSRVPKPSSEASAAVPTKWICAVQECGLGASFQVTGIRLCHEHYTLLSISNREF